jgi:hypothetical protein
MFDRLIEESMPLYLIAEFPTCFGMTPKNRKYSPPESLDMPNGQVAVIHRSPIEPTALL